MRSGYSISDIDISGINVSLGQLYVAKPNQFLNIGAMPEENYKKYEYRNPYYWNQDIHTQPSNSIDDLLGILGRDYILTLSVLSGFIEVNYFYLDRLLVVTA